MTFDFDIASYFSNLLNRDSERSRTNSSRNDLNLAQGVGGA
jgi:hypothetical protein